jgi:uncharacterized protein YjbJ (UPF0337 family)
MNNSATENKLKGKFDEVAGKVKQSVGEATHNQNLANKGTAQQVKGQAEQAWGSVKSAANDAAADARATHENEAQRKAHDVRQSISSTAQNVKNKIQNSVDDFREKHNR